MIAWACTLKEVRERIDAMIEIMGENAPVGTTRNVNQSAITAAGEYIDDVGIQIEYIYINKDTGLVVGDEANDYKPKSTEIAAVKIS